MRRALFRVIGLLASLSSVAVMAQQPAAPAARAPQTPRAAAPIDITGNWVSIVTEDWRWRMVVPKKGDYSSVPLNSAGRKVADAWDASRMAADGCRPYGAAAVMRVPGRLRIAWDGDSAIRIETDAGGQMRVLRFGAAPTVAASRSWQGTSVAEWERIQPLGGLGVSLQVGAPRLTGALKVVTTNLRGGYLRRNGVPYSDAAVVTEYFDRLTEFGTDWLVVHTTVEDPQYLQYPFITSTHFKREPDGSKFSPAPCE
jgi:hypothetical protein